MGIEIKEFGPEILPQYAEIPIRFRVKSIFRVEPVDGGLGGLRMTQEPVPKPYVKDYDENEDERVLSWPKRWDLTNWGIFLAFDGDRPIGGAAVAFNTANLDMLEGREDLAVLMDIRIRPEMRKKRIGTRIIQHAADWARARDCTQLKIETQNVNVPACKFYAKQGCHLGAIIKYVYGEPHLHREVMLLWYLDL
ncbi:MAG: GNAT family N-acetyltransferase [Phycisphaerae bacterium]|nr:GNAT family N-acetyltransferase [Phycisphaerae bacterium]